MRHLTSCIFILLVSTNFLLGQNERKRANYWHFGNNAGLNFSCPPPTSFSGSPLVSFEGSASISDLNGDLLMFTNGQTVWDRNNNVMPNGTGLLGNQSTVQAAVIVPHPGNPNRYFIFTAGTSLEDNGTVGVRFSEVDMALNGGFGDVLPGNKNTLLFLPNEEKLTAVRNAAGNGYWVTAQEKSSNRWYSYEVTATGVNMTPVISVTGPPARANNSLGAKFSPDGTMLVSQAGCGSGMSSNANLTLYSFNNATGVIEYAWSDCGQPGFAIEFSPDCSKLYATSGQHIFQYDLSLGATIIDSVPVKASKTQITIGSGNRGLQVGNDCKIYVRESGTAIGIIQNPNLAGLACTYVPNAFNLISGSHGQCFPNFIQSFFTNDCNNLDFDLTAQDASCNSDGAITLTINQGTPPYSFQWSNGATTQNVSGLSGGWHSVNVTDASGCPPRKDSIFIDQPPTALITSEIVTNPTSCGAADGSIDLTIDLVGGAPEIIVAENFETDGAGTRYTLVGAETGTSRFFQRGSALNFTQAVSGQLNSNYFGVRRTTTNPSSLTLNSTTITGYSDLELCILLASPGNANSADYYNIEYSVDGGTWTRLAAFRPISFPSNRIAEDTNNDGVGDGIQLSAAFQEFCYAVPATGNQIQIRIVTNATSTQSQFAFDNIRLSGIAPQTYSVLWSTNATTDDVNNLASGNYSIEITTSSGCVVNEDYTIIDACTLQASFIPSETNICEGETVTFTDNSNGLNIVSRNWTFNGGNPTSAATQGPHAVTFSTFGTYNVVLQIENDLGDTDDTTIVITVNALPTVTANSDSPFCDGESITLNASGGTSYSWTGPNSYSANGASVTIPSASATNAGVYTVTAIDANGCENTATTTVVYQCDPNASFTSSITTICEGETVTFTDNSGGGTITSWNWTFNGGNPGSAATQGPHTVTFPTFGTYNVVLQIEDDLGEVDDTTIVITVNALPTVTAGSDSPFCDGESITLNASGGTSYSWTGPNSYSANGDSVTIPSASATNAGVYTVTAIDANGCENTATTTVVYQCDPNASFTSSITTICEGETVTFTDNSGGGTITSWNWTFNGGNPGSAATQGPHTVTFPTFGTYNVVLQIEDDLGEVDDTTIVITVNALPTVTAGSDSPFCDGESITLSASGGTSYSWTGPNSYSASGTSVTIPSASATNAGVYTVTAIDANGCENTAATTVVYTCVSYASFNPSKTTICQGETITFTDNSGGGTITSWNWTFNGGNPSSATTQGPHSVSFATSGTYNVVLQIQDDLGEIDDTTIVITVNGLPTITASSDSPFCDGESITLNASGGTSYSWTGPNGYAATGASVTIPNAANTNAGTYTVTAIDANGCENTATTTVVYTCVSFASFVPSETTICEGETVTFTDNSGGGTITSWNWTFNGGNPSSATTQGPHSVSFATAGTYNVVLQIQDDLGEVDDTTIVITVNALPTATASNNGPMCTGANLTLTASGGTSYAWTGPNGYSETGAPVTIPNVTVNAFGTYTVTVTDANGCKNTAQTTLQMGTGPSITVAGTNVSCFGGTNGQAVVTPSSGVSPYTYSWSPSGATTQTASNLSSGTHTVSVTDANGCVSQESVVIGQPTQITLNFSTTPSQCTSNTGTATVVPSGGTPGYSYSWSPAGGNGATTTAVGPNTYTVTVSDANNCQVQGTTVISLANSPVISLQSSQNVSCNGGANGNIQVQTTGGTGAYTYNWNPAVGNGSSAANLTAGTYNVTVIDNAGCSNNLSVTITQPTKLLVSQDVTNTTCGVDDGSINLSPTGGTGTYTYNWNPNISSTNSATNLAIGTYNIVVADANGCSVPVEINIEIGSSFFIDAYPENSVIDLGGSVNLNVYVDPTISVNSIVWTPPTGLSCVNCNNPTATPNQTTTYIVSVSSANGCVSKDTITIIVIEPCGELFVPNIFSPNADGLNDLECVMGDCVVSAEFTIYDRWGEIVFHTTDKNNCWDGNFRGKPVQSGVYVYKVKATLQTGEAVEQSGNINVTR
jgi:gliding motility-associated-like protein